MPDKIVTGIILTALAAAPVFCHVKIGAKVLNSSIPFFNQRASPDDLMIVRPQNLYMLKEIAAGRKTVILDLNDLAHAEAILDQAQDLGASVVGLDLGGNSKTPVPQGDLNEALAFVKMAKEDGLSVVVIPKAGGQMFRLPAWVSLVDAVILPVRDNQTSKKFGLLVGDFVARIKASFPNLKIWIEVSAKPSKNTDATPEAVLRKIAEISSAADGIIVDFGAKTWETARTVLLRLNNIPG